MLLGLDFEVTVFWDHVHAARSPLIHQSFLPLPSVFLPTVHQTSLHMALSEPSVLQGLVLSCHAPNEFLQQAATERTATTWWGLEGLMNSVSNLVTSCKSDFKG